MDKNVTDMDKNMKEVLKNQEEFIMLLKNVKNVRYVEEEDDIEKIALDVEKVLFCKRVGDSDSDRKRFGLAGG